MDSPFAVIWEFEVPPDAQAEFQRHYGPQGSWAQLFRQDPAYLETLLLQDLARPGRYLTLDRWQSATAYRSFRERFAAPYRALDQACERLTRREADLGAFSELAAELSPGSAGEPLRSLLSLLRGLEQALHQPAVRGDGARLDALLHPDFQEIGRSGRRYAKADIRALLIAEQDAPVIWSQDFVLKPLASGLGQLTYRSAHLTADGSLVRPTLRSSLWQRTPAGWQMLFHQGTPCDAFERHGG
ncbi:MAG TPA: DUF4440 domain-containing protein [Ideonella sp.]|nr:DUF4440 domain-containing protein [Ideonella sp.]